MGTLLDSLFGLSIIDTDQACLDVLKSVTLEENDGFSLKLTVSTGFLHSFQCFEAENKHYRITYLSQAFLMSSEHSWMC